MSTRIAGICLIYVTTLISFSCSSNDDTNSSNDPGDGDENITDGDDEETTETDGDDEHLAALDLSEPQGPGETRAGKIVSTGRV